MKSVAEWSDPQKPEVADLAQGLPCWLGGLFSIAIFLVFILMLVKSCLKLYMVWLCHVTSTIYVRQESFHRVVQAWIFLTIGRGLHSSATMLRLWSNAVLLPVLQPTGTSFAGRSAVGGKSEKKTQPTNWFFPGLLASNNDCKERNKWWTYINNRAGTDNETTGRKKHWTPNHRAQTEQEELGIIVDADCLFKQHISHICRKAYCSINVIFRCFHTANIAALIISYKSFVRPMLEYCSTVWNPYIPARHYLGMTDQVEKVQRYFTRRVYQRCQLDCKHSYLQRLAYLEIESLELRRIYLDLVMVHKIVRGLITADLKRYFSFAIQAPNSAVRTRGHTFKLKTTRYRLNIAHNLFFNRVVSAWNGLPQHIVNLESSLSFKKALRTVSFHSLTTFDRHM